MHYLTHCRLEFGAQMLREQPAAAVTDVALTCGFSSSQYFATVFSRRFGCSPREFRMKADGAVTQGETSACADGLREDFVDGVSFQ
jgi:AraC family L-rhamnose operon regulatory protein RhaS